MTDSYNPVSLGSSARKLTKAEQKALEVIRTNPGLDGATIVGQMHVAGRTLRALNNLEIIKWDESRKGWFVTGK